MQVSKEPVAAWSRFVDEDIEARDASRLAEATALAAEAMAHRFGRETVDGKIQAHVVTVAR